MLIAYIDEFGHQGPYISHNDKKYGTHPIFGYGGFIIPDYNVRELGGFFEKIKKIFFVGKLKKPKSTQDAGRRKDQPFLQAEILKSMETKSNQHFDESMPNLLN